MGFFIKSIVMSALIKKFTLMKAYIITAILILISQLNAGVLATGMFKCTVSTQFSVYR